MLGQAIAIRRRSGMGLLGLVAAALLATASPAQAAPTWVYGQSEQGLIGCGPLGVQPHIYARAGFLGDTQALPKVGDVFYGALLAGDVGKCFSGKIGLEFVPPAGVELAISPQTPVRCYYAATATPDTLVELTPAEGCSQQPGDGFAYGPRFLPGPDEGGTWPLYGAGRDILRIEFPLRSTRPLQGTVTMPGGCDRPEGIACPPDRAGDNLQVLVLPIPSGLGRKWLAPFVGLFVEPGPAPGAGAPVPPPAGAPASPATRAPRLVAPRLVRISRSLRGIPIRVTVPANRAAVTVTLTAGRLGRIATVRRRGVRAGRLRLSVKPTRRAARALRRARRVDATLRVTIRVSGRPAATASAKVRLRR